MKADDLETHLVKKGLEETLIRLTGEAYVAFAPNKPTAHAWGGLIAWSKRWVLIRHRIRKRTLIINIELL